MEPKFNYIVLLMLIILGVAIGNLASSFITTNYINKALKKEALEASEATTTKYLKPANPPDSAKPITPQETIKLSPENHKELEVVEKPTDHKQLIEERKLDENGARLAKKCNEWTVVHKDMNTQSSERGMEKHCAEYYDYLSFGNLPESN